MIFQDSNLENLRFYILRKKQRKGTAFLGFVFVHAVKKLWWKQLYWFAG